MRSVTLGSLSLLALFAACGGSDSDSGTSTDSATTGSSSPSSSSAADSGSGSTPKAGTPGGNSSAASSMGSAGKGGSIASANAGGPAASSSAGSAATSGSAGDAAAAAGGGAPNVPGAPSTPAMARGNIECSGKPWPARAQGGYGPFPVGPESAGLPAYWPTQDWKVEDPAKLGFDSAKLMAAVQFSTGGSSNQALLIIRHGYIAAEGYYGGFTQDQQHESYSVAESFTSSLIGIAMGEGKIPSVDQKLCEYYPDQWDCSDTMDPRSRITINHALNLTTGLQWSENWRSDSTGTNDGITTSLDGVLARQAAEEPGTRQRYSTGDPALLSGVIQKATGMNALAYAKEKVFDVIGTPGITWGSDDQGRTTTFAGLLGTAREWAKYGYLYLNYGKWDGKQVVPMDWVVKTTQVGGAVGGSPGMEDPCKDWVQYLWHVNLPTRLGIQPKPCDELFCQPTEYVNLPQDGFLAEGVQGQMIYIIPSADLVVVRFAADGFMSSELWDDYSRGFLLAVLDAIDP